MYIVIGGGGVLGAALGANLVQRGHEVVVIESDRERCEHVLAPLGVVPLYGSATSIADLERAGIRRAETAIGVMGRDADNLAFTVLCRHLQVPRVMTRMLNDRYRTPLEIAGAHLIFSEVEMVLGSLLTSIELPDVSGLMKIRRGDLAVFELRIPPNAQVAGVKVRDIAMNPNFPRQCLFVGASSGRDKVKVPSGNTVLEGGASVILVCNPEEVRAVVNYLTERRELEDVEGQARSIRKVLRELEFLSPMNDAEIEALARRSHVEYPHVGDVVFRQGDQGGSMYFLNRGKVRLEQHGEGRGRRVLAELIAPDLFGEFSVLSGQPRLADAVAAEDSELIVVDGDALRAVMNTRPEALLEITRLMSERTRSNRSGPSDAEPRAAPAGRATGIFHSVSRLLGGKPSDGQ